MAAKVRPARIAVIAPDGRRFSSITKAAIATGKNTNLIWWAVHCGRHGWHFDTEADPSLASRVPSNRQVACDAETKLASAHQPAWSPDDIATAAEEAA